MFPAVQSLKKPSGLYRNVHYSQIPERNKADCIIMFIAMESLKETKRICNIKETKWGYCKVQYSEILEKKTSGSYRDAHYSGITKRNKVACIVICITVESMRETKQNVL